MVRGNYVSETYHKVSKAYEPVSGMYGILYGPENDQRAIEFPVSSIIEINATPEEE
jgi:hypothetical protein